MAAATPLDHRGLVLRMRAAVLGHAAGGLAWGTLGVIALQITPDNPDGRVFHGAPCCSFFFM